MASLIRSVFPINFLRYQMDQLHMWKLHKGFNIIELTIVLAIIGILSAVAISVYDTYTIKARVSEGLRLIGVAKIAVAEYHLGHGSFPANNAEALLPGTISSPYVENVQVGSSGIITITYTAASGAGNGSTICFIPTATEGAVNWDCSLAGTTVDTRYLPASCT